MGGAVDGAMVGVVCTAEVLPPAISTGQRMATGQQMAQQCGRS